MPNTEGRRFDIYVALPADFGTSSSLHLLDAETKIAQEIGGLTREDDVGEWLSPSGDLMVERGYHYTLFVEGLDKNVVDYGGEAVERFAHELADILEQEEVLVCESPVSLRTCYGRASTLRDGTLTPRAG